MNTWNILPCPPPFAKGGRDRKGWETPQLWRASDTHFPWRPLAFSATTPRLSFSTPIPSLGRMSLNRHVPFSQQDLSSQNKVPGFNLELENRITASKCLRSKWTEEPCLEPLCGIPQLRCLDGHHPAVGHSSSHPLWLARTANGLVPLPWFSLFRRDPIHQERTVRLHHLCLPPTC